jgi:uncharacterized YigZ family protein
MEILEYNTIPTQTGPETIKIKGSRFLSYAIPANSQETVHLLINKFKKQYYDSTHVCYAFRIIEKNREYFRYNDDGEPSKTAGLPIFNEIKSHDYYNILVLVIRYYGGTKLGTGGLTRAYRESAKLILDTALQIVIIKKTKYIVSVPFNFIGEINSICKQKSLHICNRNYSKDGIDLLIEIPYKDRLKILDLNRNPNIKIIDTD